ncbi:hypothetical protein M595_1435 [Lyngbya aestuarii BL J]|uniref:Uncharacterized protein n=1 Tax=Lyngbya aestuarii BL J TaxID=1348334 RepID=U7QL24_9CYAN|nr:hypothetical protein M595_1435 [Lyngbya aestuarii BL J]
MELKREDNSGIREIILILLLLNNGKTQKEIAEFLGIYVDKICYLCGGGLSSN